MGLDIHIFPTYMEAILEPQHLPNFQVLSGSGQACLPQARFF